MPRDCITHHICDCKATELDRLQARITELEAERFNGYKPEELIEAYNKLDKEVREGLVREEDLEAECDAMRLVIQAARELKAAVRRFERALRRPDKPTSLGVVTDIVGEKRATLFKALEALERKAGEVNNEQR